MNKSNHRSPFAIVGRLIVLVKPMLPIMLAAIVMGVAGHFCATFITIFGGFGILRALGLASPVRTVGTAFACILVFALLRGVLRYAEQASNHYIAFKLLALIRDKVFGALRRLTPAKLEGRDRGDLISLITADIEALEVFYAHTISPICIACICVIGMTGFVGSWHILPALVLLGLFLIYPLVDVLIYSVEECYNFASQTYQGVGLYNYSYVLHDPYFLQAVENTFVLVIITVPTSTVLAIVIATALSSIKPLRQLFQTIYFLPYVTNTLAVGLVFMVLFQRTEYTDGLINLMLAWFGAGPIDFINGPHWAKMFVLCFYTIWVVLPFKILVLTSALASVNDEYYKAARVDGTSRTRTFFRITLPMISPMIVYLVITGFIGAFKAYSDAVALFGVDLNAAGMNTLVGYIYDMLYGNSGGYPSYASAAAIILFVIVLTITCINLLVTRKRATD